MPYVSRRELTIVLVVVLVLAKLLVDVLLHKIIEASDETPKLAKELSRFRDDTRVNNLSASAQYAYAFVVGGCNSADTRCDGFIFNILVAAQMLREEGSTADVVAMFQMSNNSSSTHLAFDKERAFESMNIRVLYIASSPVESFYDTVINKFKILQLTEYERIILMDGDVMPLGNLDYLFSLSVEGKLKENLVVAGALEPANGGFFMVQPGGYDSLQTIIRKREGASLRLSGGYKGYQFDVVRGWGQTIDPPDRWVARRPGERGNNWTFHFAFSDQGLLYHWTKYYKKSVSIVFEDKVENWAADESGVVRLEVVLEKPFANFSKPRIRIYAACHKFMCDFMHFAGNKKPWLKRPPKDLSDVTRNLDAYHIWWYTLNKLDSRLGLRIDFANWRVWQQPPLGGYATLSDMEKRARVMANTSLA